jgi:uncharacterized protein
MVPSPCIHRHVCPLPIPTDPWQWRQHWSKVLFMHWPVAPSVLRGHVPAALKLDTWEDLPWVSLVAFHLDSVRHRRYPSFGLVSNTIELNLRTYVSYRAEPAIYFLSIHANRRLTVALAKWLTPLPYVRACMDYQKNGVAYRFRCASLASAANPLGLDVEFTPLSDPAQAERGSLTEWLVERYGLYANTPRGQLVRTAAEHVPWQLQDVSLKLRENTIAQPFGLALSRRPALAHFARDMQAMVWPFRP